MNYNFASGSIFYIFATSGFFFFFFTVEDLLLHDLYVLAAFAEQESSSERLKQVSFYRNFLLRITFQFFFFFFLGGLEFYLAL